MLIDCSIREGPQVTCMLPTPQQDSLESLEDVVSEPLIPLLTMAVTVVAENFPRLSVSWGFKMKVSVFVFSYCLFSWETQRLSRTAESTADKTACSG